MKIKRITAALLAAVVTTSSFTVDTFANSSSDEVAAYTENDNCSDNSANSYGFKVEAAENNDSASKQGDPEYDYVLEDYGTDDDENPIYSISQYRGAGGNIAIPSEIDGKKITAIGAGAFRDCTELISVTIPDSITSIDWEAFYDCTSLKEVTIPASVTFIVDEAFGYYEDEDTLETKKVDGFKINYVKNTWGHLYAVQNGFTDEACLVTNELDDGTLEIAGYAGNSATYEISAEIDGKKVTQIAYNAFMECTELTSITIPDGVTSIGSYAFFGCKSLETVSIPASVRGIGLDAFFDCTSLKEVTIPASVTDIGDEAFGYYGYYDDEDNMETKKVDGFKINYVKYTWGHWYATKNGFSDEATCIVVDELEDGALEIAGYAGNSAIYDIPAEIDGKKVTQIGDNAFSDCTELTSVTIPDSITKIDDRAFYDCTSLETIAIPTSVTEIGFWAFIDCTSLKEVTIPASVTNIGEEAFGYYYDKYDDCTKKIDNFKIYCYSGTEGEQYAKENGFDYVLLDKLPTLSKVGGVKLDGRAADALRINWAKNANADGYIVEIYKDGKWARAAKITSNATTTYRASGLKASTVYKFRVKAYKMYGSTAAYSDYSAELEARTNPSVMTGVKLSGRAADALRINWTKNASADGYIVEMYQGNKWVRVAKITNNSTTTFRKAGLKASSVYKFRVRAYKMSGSTALYGNYSATVAARTNPSVIKGAKLGGRAADALRINWTKNTSADGYIVEMYQGNKWVRVAKITNSNTTTFRKAGLKASTVYKFRVRAYKMSGSTALYGNYSATVTARTNPSVVKGVKIAGKAKDALRLSWTKNSSTQGYIVEMYKGGKWVRVAKITNSNTTTFRKAGLAKNTAYKFRVKAYYMSGKTALYGNYGSVSGKTAAK